MRVIMMSPMTLILTWMKEALGAEQLPTPAEKAARELTNIWVADMGEASAVASEEAEEKA